MIENYKFLDLHECFVFKQKEEDAKKFVSAKMFWKCYFKEHVLKDCMIIISYGIISNKQMLYCTSSSYILIHLVCVSV
jgi:hypothetical protein